MFLFGKAFVEMVVGKYEIFVQPRRIKQVEDNVCRIIKINKETLFEFKGLVSDNSRTKKRKWRQKMKKLLGIVFLVAAALVLYFGSVGWPSLDVNLWSLIPVGLFLYFTLENFLKKDYKASLMCLIIAFIIVNAIFDLLPISSGLVIGAGVLACIGLGYLFPDKDKKEGK